MRLPPFAFHTLAENHFNDFIMPPSHNECSKDYDNNMDNVNNVDNHNTSAGSSTSTLLDLSHFDTVLPMPAADRPTALYNNLTEGSSSTSNASFSKAVGGHLKPRPITARQLSTQMSVNTSRNLAENLHSLTDIFSRMDNFSNSSVGTSLVSSLEDQDDSCDQLSSGPSSAAPSECGGNSSNNKAKLKTVLCKYFLAGDCSRGDKCSFAHGREDLKEVDYDGQESQDVLSSASSVVSAKTVATSTVSEGANPNRKTKLCRNLFEDGLCPFSVNCNFAHSLDELKHTPGHVKHNSRISSSKPTELRRGSKNWSVVEATKPTAATATVPAVNDPKLYKTRMCKHFVKTGKCWLQADCRFAHGEDELRGEQEAARVAKALQHQQQ